MELSNIRVGQRVSVTGQPAHVTRRLENAIGTVININGPGSEARQPVGIEFDAPVSCGHNLRGTIATSLGLWVEPEYITLLSDAGSSPTPQAAEPRLVTNPVVGRRYRIVDVGPRDGYYRDRAQWIGLEGVYTGNNDTGRDGFLAPVLNMVRPGLSQAMHTPFLAVKLAEIEPAPEENISNPLYRELRAAGYDDSGLHPPPDGWDEWGLSKLAQYVLDVDSEVVNPAQFDALHEAAKAIRVDFSSRAKELNAFLTEIGGGK